MAHFLEAKGKAVKRGKGGERNTFKIITRQDTEGALANITVAFDGPSKPKLEEFRYQTGKVFVSYWPDLPGTYYIQITKGGIDIPGSPYKCIVEPPKAAEPEKIHVSGDGLASPKPSTGNIVKVDTREAAVIGKLKAYMSGKAFPICKYGKPDVYVEDGAGVHEVKFVPKFAGPYKLYLEFEKFKVPGSPFELTVVDPSAPEKAKEVYPQRHTPKRALFTTPAPQRLKMTNLAD